MQLTVKDVSKYLNVSEKTIYRMIQRGEIPVHRVGEQFRFNRTDLIEWSTARRMNVSPDLFKDPGQMAVELPAVSEALGAGGIFYRIEGHDRETALRSLVRAMALPLETDRELLVNLLIAREELASTGVGDGFAIPHVRNPIVLPVERPMISLGLLETPVDFGALDGKPVFAMFMLICPAIRTHLHLLSRLAFALSDPGLKSVLIRQGSREEVLAALRRVEHDMAASQYPAAASGAGI
ncbi:MAG: PTS sugar transporter subunit IIA [Kiritimatiellaeota bacterium]|nr:PTS sugar transporter subunit IIA [Kiritimatiellota bacterium]